MRKAVISNGINSKFEEFKIEVSFNPCFSTALILLRFHFVTWKIHRFKITQISLSRSNAHHPFVYSFKPVSSEGAFQQKASKSNQNHGETWKGYSFNAGSEPWLGCIFLILWINGDVFSVLWFHGDWTRKACGSYAFFHFHVIKLRENCAGGSETSKGKQLFFFSHNAYWFWARPPGDYLIHLLGCLIKDLSVVLLIVKKARKGCPF